MKQELPFSECLMCNNLWLDREDVTFRPSKELFHSNTNHIVQRLTAAIRSLHETRLYTERRRAIWKLRD